MTPPPRRPPGRPGTERATQALPPTSVASGVGSGSALALLCVWTVFLVAALAFLHAIGGALAPPPVGDPGRLGDWVARRQPAEAAVALVRLLAIAVAWYLLAVTVAGTVARLAGVAPLIRAADAISLPAVQRLVSGAMGVSMVAAVLVGAGAAAGAGERIGSAADPPGETMRRLPDAGAAGGPGNATAPDGGGGEGDSAIPPTMRRLPTTPAEAAPPFGAPRPGPLSPATRTGAAVPADPVPEGVDSAGTPSWRVQPGDHFWSVAERVLAETWHRSPTDAEVDPYWRALIEANTAILRDPANPDLLFPDQVIALPPPPAGRTPE